MTHIGPLSFARRRLLLTPVGLLLADGHAATVDAMVVPGRALLFPRDEGSHPDFKIEWWYVTGWLSTAAGQSLGFQVTFFRHRVPGAQDNPSRFAPRQLIVGHAALSDARRRRLLHAQRIGRSAFRLADADEGKTDVRIDAWSLRATSETRLHATVVDREFGFELDFERTQPVLLHGEQGFSRKGPSSASASYYYTLPHLAVSGHVTAGGARERVSGAAWLDHEWSSAPMEADASGWDWIGINLDDGGALMAFRMRDAQGGALWAGATLRDRVGRSRAFGADQVRWTATQRWQSPRTQASYPVGWKIIIGDLNLDIDPLMADQEQDARMTTGTVYWEGAVTARSGQTVIGRGYLEMTGYWRAFRL